MNVRDAMEIISNYISMLHNQGILSDCEIKEISDAEYAVYVLLDAMGV